MNGMIGYSEFIEQCQIEDPRDWGGFRVAGDGVYVIPPPDDAILFPAERAALTWHPTGNLLEPALRFPCTRSELQMFLKEIGEIEFLYTDEDSAELPTLRVQEPSIEAPPAPEQVADKKKPGRKPGDHKEKLRLVLDALDAWAGENGRVFDRHEMPGPLGEKAEDEGSFHWLCASLYQHDFTKSKRAFEEHRAGICAIAAYAAPTDFYRDALPHIAQKLGRAGNVSKLPTKATKAA